MPKNINIQTFDALVIGSGISGLVAARRLAETKGRSIAILGTGVGASPYVHGFNMPLHPEDSVELFLKDTLVSGRGQCDVELATTLCSKAPELIPVLKDLGIEFDRNEDGSYSLLRPLGASVPRVASAGNHTGVAIMNAIKRELEANPTVYFMDNTRALRFIKSGDRVIGAVVADYTNELFSVYVADVVVLACGGFCNIYPFSTNSADIGGDGVAAAYYAGAELTDMEFIQFEPSAAVAPAALRGKSVITTMYFEGAVLKNAKGERFMLNYSEDAECVNKDVQARCIFREIAEGRGTENGGVFFDATGVGREKLDSLYPSYVKRYADVGIDIATTPFEIAPAPHTSLGGVVINSDCSVKGLSGLYACGEAVGGIHGANRVGGNAGLEILVFGNIAGESASKYLAENEQTKYVPCMEQADAIVNREGIPPVPGRADAIRAELGQILSEDLNVLRNGAAIEKAIETLNALLSEVRGLTTAIPFWGIVKLLRLENDLIAALALAHSALLRNESCGCHVRTDCPDADPASVKYRTVVSYGEDGTMKAGCKNI